MYWLRTWESRTETNIHIRSGHKKKRTFKAYIITVISSVFMQASLQGRFQSLKMPLDTQSCFNSPVL